MKLSHIATRTARLSTILREEMSLSAGLVNRLKWHEKILVNGKPEHTDFAVQTAGTITALLDTPEIQYPAEQGELSILYEDALGHAPTVIFDNPNDSVDMRLEKAPANRPIWDHEGDYPF